MFGLSSLNRTHRMVIGIIVLLIVNVIWVVSSELTEYIFQNLHYNKPFFTTYIKTVMFSLYLLGFLFWRPWRHQCCQSLAPVLPNLIPEEAAQCTLRPETDSSMIGSPIYVPVKYESCDSHASGGESDDAISGTSCRSVRFSNLSEVRQLSDEYALDHKLARLSYQASVEVEEKLSIYENKMPIREVIKLALIFCFLWFFANYTYQEALNQTEAGVVNVLSCTSGLFTLICSAIMPSASGDKFTLSKLTAVILSLGGVTLVCISETNLDDGVPAGALWALLSALLYSLYLTLVKRKVENEDKMDIPMFFGFVGFLCAIFLWPGLLILDFSHEEEFSWPDKREWLFILLNGAIGTVFSEFLWLWGCFLTSSLIATLSLALVIPLTMIADGIVKGIDYGVLFYIGTIPVFISFFVVSLLTHWESWDPVLLGLKKCLHFLCKRRTFARVRELDREQATSLISEETHQ